MIGLLRSHSELSKLFVINLEIFRLRAGILQCPMASPCELRYLQRDWFVTTSDFLQSIGCSISTKSPVYFQLKCQGDRNLMDMFISAGFSKRWLVACNRCRIFLRAITVSNIADPLGRRIPQHVLKCRSWLNSCLEWPMQVCTSKRNCTIWKKALRKTLLQGDKFCHLKSPLGQWFSDPEIHHRTWTNCVAPEESHFYQYSQHGWQSYGLTAHYGSYAIRSLHPNRTIPPKLVVPVEVSPVSDETVFYRSCDRPEPSTQPPCENSSPVKWWKTGGQSSTVIRVALFHNTCQCECIHKAHTCHCHAMTSSKNYPTLIATILWAVRALSSAGCNDDTIRVESNFPTRCFEKCLYARDDDYWHVIHREAAAESEIRQFLKNTKCAFSVVTLVEIAKWSSTPTEKCIALPQ